MKLTKANVAGIGLPDGVKERIVFDDVLPGFGLRVRAGGKRTWIAQYRMGRKQRRLTLGTVETVDPEEARKRAKSALAKVSLGTDPQSEKVAARAQTAVTLGSVADDYLVRFAAKRQRPSTLAETERYLRSHWSPLRDRPIHAIARAEIAAQLGRIAEKSGLYAANRARAALSTLYAWAIAEGMAEANPVVGTNKATEEVARDRVLTDDELALIWRKAGSGDFAIIVRILILTGQRREEVAAMTWQELNLVGAAWRIGAERTKNSRPHDVPLSKAALDILSGIVKRDERELVFGEGDGPFSGWSNAKAALDTRISRVRGSALAPWRIHDIRRTVATRLADLGTLPHIVEAALNHISGTKAGVAGVYNRAVYAAEKRAALDAWAQRVTDLTAGG